MNKRLLGPALALAVTAGCSPSPSPESGQWIQPVPAIDSHAGVGNEQVSQLPADPAIKMGRLALGPLPQAVADEIDSAVRIDTSINSASGVAVDGGFLTAGHVFRDENKNGAPRTDCSEPAVTLRSSHDTVITAAASKTASVFDRPPDDPIHNAGLDAAFISTKKLPGVSPVKLENKSTDMKPGEKVFVVSYGPTGSGTQRSPDMQAPYDQPAIFSGFVVDDPKGTSKPTIFAFGYGQSYGKVRDALTRPGFSGGEILDEKGVMKAIISGHVNPNPTVGQTELDFNVDFKGIPGASEQEIENKTIQMVLGQPMDKQVVTKLRKQLEPVQPGAC